MTASMRHFCLFVSLICSMGFVSWHCHANPLVKTAPYAKLITSLGNYNLGEANTIYQDKKGYIWIGTNDGLLRFDGHNTKRFTHDTNNPHSLHHNQVFGLVEDNSGNLWVSTYGGGLAVYSPKTDQFKPIDLRVNLQDPPAPNRLYVLTLDADNQLWIGSPDGLQLVDTLSQKALEVPLWLKPINHGLVHSVVIDKNSHLWIATNDNGLFLWDKKNLHHFKHDPAVAGSLDHNQVRVVYEDPKGDIWVGTKKGLNQLVRNNKRFSRFVPSTTGDLGEYDDDIFAIQTDDYGSLWLGSLLGVLNFDPKLQKFRQISATADIQKTFKKHLVNKIIKDKNGSLWFATVAGVIYLPKTALQFNYLSNPNGTLKVTDIDLLEDGTLALVASDKVYDIDMQTFGSTRRFSQIPAIYRLTAANNGDLWLSSYANGLQHYSKASDTLTAHLQDSFLLKNSVSIIYDAFIDNQERLWILSYHNAANRSAGLALNEPKSRKLTHTLDRHNILDIVQFDNNTLALTSDVTGLYLVDANDFSHPAAQQNIPGAPQNIVTAFKDKQGRLWLGSSNQGLALYQPSDQSFTFYTTEDGLLSNSINSIIEDDEQRLWLGSGIGLTRFDPQSKKVLNIEKQDGLAFTAFRKRTAIKHKNGKILMGTKSGLVVFDPNKIAPVSRKAQVNINDFKLFNKPVKIHAEQHPSVLKQAIEFTEHIILSYQQSIFSFHFSATEYLRPDKVQFAYRMVGLNDNWIYTDTSNPVATFTALPANDYVFEVKASNNSGSWPEQPRRIKVTINPPLWLTWPAYALYFMLIMGSLYGYILSRTQKLKKQAKVLEQSVAQRTKELEEQKQTVSELLAQKQQLFANVSHEFRTPLTLILSPTEQLLKRYGNEPWSKELNLIKRSGRRLLRMVDQLLEFAKLEQGSDCPSQLVCVKQTIKLIAASFEPLLQTKQLTLTVHPFTDVSVQVLPDSLNKILINILSNAVKYTPENGHIELTINQRSEQVDISVTDTGIGINPADQQTIFQRFNRATHDHGELIPGAGIGLALVKELVEANQGKIDLSSELGRGSTFIVTLPIADPINQEQFNSAQIDPTATSVLSEQQLELDFQQKQQQASRQQNLVTLINQAPADSQLKTILIIDDNADLRTLLHNQLGEHYFCLQAENGQKGLELAKEHLPDLILSDVMMPVMDGYQLAQLLKSDNLTHHIPIILLTAKGSVESRIKGLQLLVDDYLAKPFNLEELLLRIKNILTIRDIVKSRYAQAIEGSATQHQAAPIGMTSTEQQFYNQINEYLIQNYQDPDTSAKVLANQMALSDRQLQRKIKTFFNLGYSDLVRNFRLTKAVDLLTKGDRASNIYHTVGFSSHSYFSQCFKAKFGQSPSAYQQAHGV
ncbi:MAG: response regulator [Algicola sp.]|nr:response regulator [Algicola sp.]